MEPKNICFYKEELCYFLHPAFCKNKISCFQKTCRFYLNSSLLLFAPQKCAKKTGWRQTIRFSVDASA